MFLRVVVNCKNAKQLGDSLNINREVSEKERKEKYIKKENYIAETNATL